ncbi:MAG TPA: two-component regulator propeller domain-containing protein [Pyrinomonadaceae bacterium]|nr:two-component regulator propeller domain-containing protein [Pyrinomonadaceae bacterium]
MCSNPFCRSLSFLTILIFIVSCFSALAQSQEYGFDIWTTANGLPQNTVTGVVQTPDGYLWVSTFDGLARFDGVKFTIFDKGNTKGILNNRFSGLFVDKEGVIWATTENGVITVYRNGVFSSHQSPETTSSSVKIISDVTGEALIETSKEYYYLKEDNFIPAAEKKEPNVKQIYGTKSGAKWIFRADGASRLKDGQTTNYSLTLPNEYLNPNANFQYLEDSQGALWLTTKDKIYRLANEKVTVFTQNEIPALSKLSPFLILDDREGNVWFIFGNSDTTQNLDWQFVSYKDEKFTTYNLGKLLNAGQGITDREGNFWLATTAGLRRLRPQLISTLSVNDGLVSNEVYPLLQTTKGDIFIGTVQGVNRYSDGKITNLGLKYSADFPFPLYMRGLWEDQQRRVWLGFQGEGGFGRFEEPSSIKKIGQNSLPNGVTDFTSDREGNIWIATEEGLFKYRDDKELAYYTIKDGLQNDKIITLHFDQKDNLWLGTFDGLSQFKDGKFISYNDALNSPKGFVRAIYEDADGVLWFGTYGDGLVRYKDGKFFNYRVENGLFNNGVFAILEDDRSNFWMSSNRGIHRVSKQELNDFADGKIPKLNSVSYDEKDGMLNAECNGGRIPAAIKAKDGKLWFATMGGVAIVDPDAEKVNPNPPNVIIENISIDRKAVDLTASPKEIELKPGQTNVAIEYTGLSLIKSEQIKFRYKLEGLESNWIEADTKRTVDYSYLPAGTYTFRLIAANANGVWNNEGTAIKIIVRPYFYQTWWFYLLLSLVVALIIGVIYQNRISYLRNIAETKTKFSQQLIESQEAERKRIAAELHDGLGQNLVVIKNRAMLAIKKGDDKERVAKELDNISETVTQALEEVREITNNLRPQLLDRIGLTKAINSMLKKVSGVIEIESEIDNIDRVFNEIGEISIYRIIQESLNNVIKHSGATKVSVKIKRTENNILLIIEDNGKGFDLENVNLNGSGLGLVGLKERSQLLNGELQINSEIRKGTTIEVKIHIPK